MGEEKVVMEGERDYMYNLEILKVLGIQLADHELAN